MWNAKKPNAKRIASEFCSYMIYLPFDVAADTSRPAETQGQCIKNFVAGLNWIGASIRSNAGVKAWRTALEQAEAPVPGHDAQHDGAAA